jgi:hypothetical protein
MYIVGGANVRCMGKYQDLGHLHSIELRNPSTMDNLHVKLNFNLSKEKGIKTRSKKSIMKLVKLQNLVAKCCNAWKILFVACIKINLTCKLCIS